MTIFAASKDSYGPASNMIVLYLEAGDRIWVKAFHSPGNVFDGGANTFAGLLLYPAV